MRVYEATSGALPSLDAPLTLVATPAPEGADGRRSVTFSLPESAELRLDPGSWDITCRQPAAWCPTRNVTLAAGATTEIVIDVYAKRNLIGILRAPEGGELPAAIVAQGRVRAAAGSAALLGSVEEVVPVEKGGRFALSVPMAVLDLRLAAERFAPGYVWGFDAAAEGSLPALELQPGGSLSGFALGDDGRGLGGVRVEARQALTVTGDTSRRLSAFTPAATSGEEGFFQVPSLLPGFYDLVATAPGYGDERLPAVEVRAEEETHVGAAIAMRRGDVATLLLDPPSASGAGSTPPTSRCSSSRCSRSRRPSPAGCSSRGSRRARGCSSSTSS